MNKGPVKIGRMIFTIFPKAKVLLLETRGRKNVSKQSMAIFKTIMEGLKIGFLLVDIGLEVFIAPASVATEHFECIITFKLLAHLILLLTFNFFNYLLHHRYLFSVSKSSWVIDAKQAVNIRVGGG